ncbi:MAG: DUF5777 family beta-barrel protein [Vicinamibacterales bacterium]
MRIRMFMMALAITAGLGPAYAAGVENAGDQTPTGQQAAPSAPPDDPDLDINSLQPEFTIVNLPTTLRMPRNKLAFRLTHRFGRPLGAGTFGNLAADLFGLDTGAQVGLELRYGLMRGTQLGIHRTSDRTVELFGQHDLWRQSAGHPVGLGINVTVEGMNNFKERYTPSLGLALSREIKGVGSVYAEPMWVGNVNVFESFVSGDDNTVLVGLGARIRLRPTVYFVGEFAPRLAGYDAGAHHRSIGIEKRAGGHSFQLNFSNGTGSTIGQLARGGTGSDDWYIGFNISRKFF